MGIEAIKLWYTLEWEDKTQVYINGIIPMFTKKTDAVKIGQKISKKFNRDIFVTLLHLGIYSKREQIKIDKNL